MTQESLLAEFCRHFGSLWEPDSTNLLDEYGDTYMAAGVKRQLDEIFASPLIKSRFPKLTVHVAILPRADTRCFVWPTTSKTQEYILAIYYGTFANTREYLQPSEFWEPIRQNFNFLGALHHSDLPRLATHMTVSALAYHEASHIMRGHFSFVEDAKATGDNEEIKRRRKLCEADADKWSSFILGGDILRHAENVSQQIFSNTTAARAIIPEMLQILAAALYRCFAVFNQVGIQSPTLYPHPILRAMRVVVGAADNAECGNIEPVDVLPRLAQVLAGLSQAEEYVKNLPAFPQRPWDLSEELFKFEQEYAEALKKLNQELLPFFPK